MSVNQFRRFTYLISSEDDASGVIGELTSDYIKNQLQHKDIYTYEVYQESEDYFLLIDASVEMNNTYIQEKLSTLNISFEASPLERIYKLEQKEVYTPNEGQLKTSVAPYKRFVWTLLLEPDLIEEYKHVHAMGQAWPEITQNMKIVGVKDMEIYIKNDKVVLIMDAKPDFDLDEVGPKWQKLPREEEWQAYVAKFQKTDPESSIQEKWQDMIKL